MDRTEVIDKLTAIFRNVFEDESLILNYELTANDIPLWDSLSHMILVSKIEETFSIKFQLKDLTKMKNVGTMIDILISKL